MTSGVYSQKVSTKHSARVIPLPFAWKALHYIDIKSNAGKSYKMLTTPWTSDIDCGDRERKRYLARSPAGQ
jgi:hypothetical protein